MTLDYDTPTELLDRRGVVFRVGDHVRITERFAERLRAGGTQQVYIDALRAGGTIVACQKSRRGSWENVRIRLTAPVVFDDGTKATECFEALEDIEHVEAP